MSFANSEGKMSQDKDDETVAAQESLLKNVKIQESQEQTGANDLMDIIIKKVQSNDATIRHQRQTKTVFEISKKMKQRALIMQVGQ